MGKCNVWVYLALWFFFGTEKYWSVLPRQIVFDLNFSAQIDNHKMRNLEKFAHTKDRMTCPLR